VFRFQVQAGSQVQGAAFAVRLAQYCQEQKLFSDKLCSESFPMISSRSLCLHTVVSSLHLLYAGILGIHNLRLLST
jgi:hypothetical protein